MTSSHQDQAGLHIVGGGLAGCEAAWQAIKQNVPVYLYEMKKIHKSPAHQSEKLAELVCSNSLKSLDMNSAPGLLKSEMKAFGSLILEAAMVAKVPAGQALAVEREVFSDYIEAKLTNSPLFKRIDQEIIQLPDHRSMSSNNQRWIVATGPLTADSLCSYLKSLLDPNFTNLSFYDAIAPIVSGDSIDMNYAFVQDRYGEENTGDYLNIGLDKVQYETFVDAILSAEYMPLHSFEKVQYFEACLPIEVLAARGKDTLRFGPMKPVGLHDPHTNRRPYAAIQLRKENNQGSLYSIVGFQTKMKWPEQKRIFSTLPALKNAEFVRLGSVHRNTYFNSPQILNENLSTKANPFLFLAGQITGVEGYTESAAIGLLAGLFAANHFIGRPFYAPPPQTVLGSLYQYITLGCKGAYQPMNANLGLLQNNLNYEKKLSKSERKAIQCKAAAESMQNYLERLS